MQLTNYINDLLYRYDCVIVPNFGGFIANKVSAKINSSSNIFYPPTKQITFNSHLKHNDGLLANHIASIKNISFDEAVEEIAKDVVVLQKTIENSPVVINSVGKLLLNEEKQYVFEPNQNTNFLKESFGLSTLESSVIERIHKNTEVLTLNSEVSENKTNKKNGAFVKYAATAAILVTLGIAGYNKINQQTSDAILAKQQKEVEQKIQQATFVIENPLPTINLNITKEENRKRYYLVAGAFKLKENAERKVIYLRSKGFSPEILEKNKWGLTQVSFYSFNDANRAKSMLRNLKNKGYNDVWMLVK